MRNSLLIAASILAITLTACGDSSTKVSETMTKAEASVTQKIDFTMPSVEMPAIDNVLLAVFKGPYGGVPAFDKMDLAALKPALEWGMEKNLKEVEGQRFQSLVLRLRKTKNSSRVLKRFMRATPSKRCALISNALLSSSMMDSPVTARRST